MESQGPRVWAGVGLGGPREKGIAGGRLMCLVMGFVDGIKEDDQ